MNHLSKEEKARKLREDAQALREKIGGDYYSAKEAIDDVYYADGIGGKAAASAKLIGKSLFNIGRFIGSEILPAIGEQNARKLEKDK